MAVYLVLEPLEHRGIYATWPECEAKVKGVGGAKFQKVATLEQAEALLNGDVPTMGDGTYAFIDGNHLGGIGVVLVHQKNGQTVTKEIATTVAAVLPSGVPIPGDLGGLAPLFAGQLLSAIKNIAAEMVALYQAIVAVKPGTSLTVVHDYAGVGAWMDKRWKMRDPHVIALAAHCHAASQARNLRLSFHYLKGHQGDATGRNPWVQYNRRADELATRAALAAGA